MSHVPRQLLAEFVGTGVLVLVGCGGLTVSDRFPGSLPAWSIPLLFGLAAATMIRSMGAISGGHFNPAVTAAFAVTGHLPKHRAVGYWLAQVTGALAAIGLLILLLPPGTHFGGTVPSVSPLQALGWEALWSFVLMGVILAVSTDVPPAGAAVAIGATIAMAAWVGGPVTGASMNPARSFAPLLAEGNLGELWIYVLGPLAGTLAAAFVYPLLFVARPPDRRHGEAAG